MSSWTARVEWATHDAYTEDALDVLMGHLEGHGAAVGPALAPTPEREPIDLGPDLPGAVLSSSGHWSATLTLEANTLRQAIAAALELVEKATGEKAVAVEVLPTDVYDLRVQQPTIPELVGYAEIAEMFGVTRQRARQLVDLPGFPAAVVETAAGPLRVRRQVEGWGRGWERKGGRPRKAQD